MAEGKRILLIDNTAETLAQTLALYGYDVVHEATGAQALAYLDSGEEFDLVLTEAFLPDIEGWEVLKTIRNSVHYGHLPVIFVTTEAEPRKMVYGLNLGADDYVVKPYYLPNLLARVEAVLRRTCGNEITPFVANVTNNQNTSVDSLTTREKDVLLLVTQGLDNESIAKELCVTKITVKAHLQRVFKKLKVKNRTQAVLTAMENNLISSEK